MTEPKAAAPEPKVATSETRSQPKTQATPVPDTEAVATRAREAERDRVSTIYDLAGRLNLERGFAEDLVKRGVSVDKVRRLILDQVAAKSDETRTFGHVSVPLGGRNEHITRRDAVANALLHRYSPTLFQLEDAARQYRGMTLLELARESLGNAGVNTRGLSRDEVATRALHSTSDFPEILSAVTNKTLRQAYDAYPEPSCCSAARCSPPTSRRCTGSSSAKRRSCWRSARAGSSSAGRSASRRRATRSRPTAGWSRSPARR